MRVEPMHSVEMEMATLGSFMLGDDAPEIVRSILPSPDMFYRPSHRVIYRALLDLMDDGLPADLTFCAERLGIDIEEIGGESYLFQIAEYVPSPSLAEHYAKMVLDLWAKRRLCEVADRLEPQSSLTEVSVEIDGIMNGATRGISKPNIGVIGDFDSENDIGVATPWAVVNSSLSCGGFPLGEFCLVRAKTGVGKTPFLTQAAIEAAKAGRKVIYATFADLDARRLQGRMMKYLTGWGKPPTLNLDLSANWQAQKKYLKELGIVFYDATSSAAAKEVETFISWLEYNHSGATDVYVDYLQEIRTRRFMDRIERQDSIASELKMLASRLNIACLMGTQISNNAQEGDMTKGGRDADDKAAVIFDIKPNEDRATGELRLVKNRYGPVVALNYRFDNQKLAYEVTE